ncbi:hypothetical protein GCM10012289_69290 [Nonomuraea cavernae]|uniref:Uncharacterized protein n=1 Tax=Nonomuraea cavernae TaxID=2045107 RepID=A0A918DRY9_9ACTN|nr:hypothetical protein GCM10012289_69290 [Nonomuraea cavernae]
MAEPETGASVIWYVLLWLLPRWSLVRAIHLLAKALNQLPYGGGWIAARPSAFCYVSLREQLGTPPRDFIATKQRYGIEALTVPRVSTSTMCFQQAASLICRNIPALVSSVKEEPNLETRI